MAESNVILIGYPDGDGFGAVKKVHASTLERQQAKGFVQVEKDSDGNVSAVKAKKARPPEPKPEEGTDNQESN